MFGRNMNLDENILRKNKIPILFNDLNWIKLFADSNDKNIQNAKEVLMDLLAKEKEIELRSNKLQREKSKCMKMILGVSDSVNNENKTENIVLLDEYKERILDINEEVEDLTFKLETMPKEIREANFKLLNDTVKFSYDELKYKEKIVKQSVEEIEILRKKLQELMVMKHDYEEWINETYTFLHGILGSEIIEELDKERLK